MATQLPNSFTSFEFTNEEFISATSLSILQEARIQTLISNYAEARLNLIYNPNKPEEFMQKEAEFMGAINVLKLILDDSKIARTPPTFVATDILYE